MTMCEVPSVGGPFGDDVIASWQEALDWPAFERWYQFCEFHPHGIDRNSAYLAYMVNRMENTIERVVFDAGTPPPEEWQRPQGEE